MADDDIAYLERRLRYSLKRANQAADPAVETAHRNFAAEYAAKLHADEPLRLQRVRDGEPVRRGEPSFNL